MGEREDTRVTFQELSRRPVVVPAGIPPHEEIRGTLKLELDVAAPHNQQIAGISRLCPDATGRVHVFCDVLMVATAQGGGCGNGAAVVDVANRGVSLLWNVFNSAPLTRLTDPLAAGDAFLAKQGFAYVACGWQADLAPRPGVLRMQTESPLRGPPVRVMVEIDASTQQMRLPGQPVIDVRVLRLGSAGHVALEAAEGATGEARLYQLERPNGPLEEIPPAVWRFGRFDNDGAFVADRTCICLLEGSFKKGFLYQVVYDTCAALPTGLALAALRDVAIWLKRGGGPLPAMKHVYAVGGSQTGRLLRAFLYDDFNMGSIGQEAFDAFGIWVAGASRGQFNQVAGQPSQALPHLAPAAFPFATVPATDRVTGEVGSVHARLDARGSRAKVFYINTSIEYHRGDASLLHTTPDGDTDLEIAPNARVYMLSGAPHNPTPNWPPSHGDGAPVNVQQSLTNPVDVGPFFRSSLLALHEWTALGRAPPTSVYPTLAAGTLVTHPVVYDWFRRIPGGHAPQSEHASRLWRRNFGVDPSDGSCKTLPPRDGPVYGGSLVPALDADGNDVGGLALPQVAVPLGSHLGWALRHADFGGESRTLLVGGGFVPFCRTRAERQATGDVRLSIEERYESRDSYLAQIEVTAERLCRVGLLLPDDIAVCTASAAKLWDWTLSRAS
jgi:hypothetical protein